MTFLKHNISQLLVPGTTYAPSSGESKKYQENRGEIGGTGSIQGLHTAYNASSELAVFRGRTAVDDAIFKNSGGLILPVHAVCWGFVWRILPVPSAARSSETVSARSTEYYQVLLSKLPVNPVYEDYSIV